MLFRKTNKTAKLPHNLCQIRFNNKYRFLGALRERTSVANPGTRVGTEEAAAPLGSGNRCAGGAGAAKTPRTQIQSLQKTQGCPGSTESDRNRRPGHSVFNFVPLSTFHSAHPPRRTTAGAGPLPLPPVSSPAKELLQRLIELAVLEHVGRSHQQIQVLQLRELPRIRGIRHPYAY